MNSQKVVESDNMPETPKKEPTLYKRSIKSGYWVISLRFATNLLGFVKTLIIANFFLLSDLGIISAAIMMMDILATFTQTGFEAALIQKKEDIRDYLDTVWTAGILKGVLLFAVLFFGAPLLAGFNIPEEKLATAVAVFRVMGFSFLLTGFQNIGIIYFQKDLDFGRTFALSLLSTLTDILLSILLVLIFRSIWGVIAARLISACVYCAGSYALSDYRPRPRFSPTRARELWKFGKWISGQNIIGYLLEAGDDFFVWFYLGAAKALPLYRYAYNFSNMPATQISYVISQVSFPAYAKIQDDLPRLRDAYLKVLKTTALLSIPLAFLIFTMGPDFVHLFLPERMYPMIPVLQLLSLKGLMGSLSGTWPPLARALGKPEKVTHVMLIALVILGITIYPFTKMWGITGTAIAALSVGIGASPYGYYLLCRMLKCRFSAILKQSALPLVSSVVMVLGTIALKLFILAEATYVHFFVLITGAAAIYWAAILALDYYFHTGVRQIIAEHLAQLRPTHKRSNGMGD